MHSTLTRFPRMRSFLCYFLALQFFLPGPVAAAELTISPTPLAKSASASVHPNLMFILDNSGSMDWDYLPDYIDDSDLCKDTSQSDGLSSCGRGHPPYMSADFNVIYYNPDFVYVPAVEHDGTPKPAQTDLANNRTDPFRTTSTTDNLNNYLEYVWCKTSSPAAADITNATNTTANCRVATDDYDYPDATYKYRQSRYGAPYHFRAQITAYCLDEKLTQCQQRTTPIGDYKWPARIRFCKAIGSTDCQKSYNSLTGYTKPSYLSASITAAAYSTIDITSVFPGFSISTITVDGVNIIAGSPVVAGLADTPATIATAVANAINAVLTTPEYRACVGSRTGDNACSGTPNSRVTITPQTAQGVTDPLIGTAGNGRVVATTAPAISYTAAHGTITVSGTSAAPVRVTSIAIGGTTVASGTFNAPGGLDTVAERNAFAALLAGAITGGGYTATAAGNVVTITAPPNTGMSENGKAIVVTGSQSAMSAITIGDSGSNAAVALSAAVGATTVINNSSAPTGTNDAGEAAALAATMAASVGSGYTAIPSVNVVSLFTPIGTTTTVTPTITQTPAPLPGSGATTSFTINSLSGTWQIDAISVNPAGACTLSSGDIMSGDTTSQTTTNGLAAAVVARDGSANVSFSAAGSTVTLTGTGAWLGAQLNGCTISVQVDERVDGTIDINGSSRSSDGTIANIATFGGGGAGATPTVGSATPFAGGYVNAAAGFVTTAAMSGGISTGPIGATASNFANGLDPVKSFARCDITSTSTNCGPAAGLAALPAGQFPKAAGRTDCAAAGYCTLAEERKNFGNWYSYYRKRMLAMKTGASLAFSGIGDNYRIGFVTIGNYNSGDGSDSFLPVGEFTAGAGNQKESWYSKLFQQGTPHATPLRHALSSVGRYFGGRNPYSMTSVDPMQYSCQQNFALLTTDGYWNEPWDSGIKRVDGSTMNNADGAAGTDYPYYDGGLGGTCGVGNNVSGSSSCGTLADVAYHYYITDLRTTALATSPAGSSPADDCKGDAVAGVRNDVCQNNVKGAGDDNVTWQHMTTYTLGLGVDGTLDFQDNYKTAPSGDYLAIKQGSKNWPQAKNLDPTAVDDLWHAAVNGRGQYFSARNPVSLTKNLRDALAGIGSNVGAGAAAATSNLEPSEGENNYSYVASYTTNFWYGNLEQRLMNATTGQTLEQALWCVEDVAARADKGTTACNGTLQTKVADFSDTRNIYFYSSGAANKLNSFTFANLTAAGKAALFNPALLAQYATLPIATAPNATSTTLVNFLRGQWGYEDQDGNVDRIYRDRKATLGDAVGSQPVFVGVPRLNYTDPGFAGFKSAQVARTGTVYLGTNDGMLHAFHADNGQERWAYVPSAMMPGMWQLADANYGGNTHAYFVDGSPVVGDACTANCTDAGTAVWKTILVGGFGGGGKGYYAIDVTDPDNPKGLWEMTTTIDPDFGLSYGNPIITKRDDGKWVVLLTSGYNNGVGGGSGKGYLFVVDIATGSILKKIGTNVGDTTTPSGLAKIEAVVPDSTDNKASRVYGGDLLGNLWRFTIDKDNETVVRIATLKDTSGNPQPITTRPLPTNLDDPSSTPYVVVATGKLLEQSDLTDTQVQTLYAFADEYDTSGATVGGCPGCTKGAREQLLGKTMVEGPPDALGRITRVSGTPDVPVAQTPQVTGCYADFLYPRERINVDMKLTRGTVTAVSNEPASDACTASGRSYKTDFDYKTCEVVDSFKIADALAVGIVVLKLPSGGYAITATLSSEATPVLVGGVQPAPSVGTTTFGGRRVGWRLLYD